jgi:hypothetical protein
MTHVCSPSGRSQSGGSCVGADGTERGAPAYSFGPLNRKIGRLS